MNIRPTRTALLTVLLGTLVLLSPLMATATAQDANADPAYEYADLAFVNPSEAGEMTATPTVGESATTPLAGSQRHGALLGDPDAPVTLQIYADYQCPHCRNFHDTIEPQLINDYVRTGKIRLEFIDFPVIGIKSLQDLPDDSKESVQAAEAAMCAADQDAYMPYREALYAGDLKPNSGALSDDNLVRVADELDLDTNAFAGCLESGRHEEAILTGFMTAYNMGVQRTPSLAIDGEVITLTQAGYDGLKPILDETIEQAQ